MDQLQIFEKLSQLLAENKLGELKRALDDVNVVDIADFLETLHPDQQVLVFRILSKDLSADVFSYMEPEQQQHIVESISDNEVRAILDDLFLDDAVDFLEEVPASVVNRVLRNIDEHTRNLINAFLRYPENSAGSIMTIEYVALREHYTVRQAMDEIRRTGVDKETIYTCYIIDEKRHLQGSVALHTLILSPDETPIAVVMDDNIMSVRTLDDQETVADNVRKYDLLSMPVVDNENRLVGIITADDIMDVIEEENTEDFEKMAALRPAESDYLRTSVWQMARNRIPWLLLLMVSAAFTGKIITYFSDMLSSAVVLAAYIPMLMDSGGNCGAQSSTLIIRGLALGEVQFRDVLRVLFKEFQVSIIVGVILSAVNFGRVMMMDSVGVGVAFVVSVSLFLTVVIAKAIGCTLPLLAKKIKLDPALMASPMITTIVDACSLTIYFSIASAVLRL